MRAKAIASAAVIALAAAAGAASAETWTDPNGRLTFDKPAGWSISTENMPGVTYIVAGTADNECHIIAIPRDQLATAAANDVRRAGADDAQNGAEVWTQRGNAIPSIFPNNSANVLSRSSEAPGFWTIQRAEIQGPERLVHAAQSIRPGFEFQTYCQTYEGADPTAVYDSVIRSVAHPNDATWQAQAEQQQAEREAAGAQQAEQGEAPAEEEQPRRQRRQRGLTTGAQGNAPM
ncbi:MAG: hypothetical protein AB7P07_09195 [Hyphomonadaceae bacterium]